MPACPRLKGGLFGVYLNFTRLQPDPAYQEQGENTISSNFNVSDWAAPLLRMEQNRKLYRLRHLAEYVLCRRIEALPKSSLSFNYTGGVEVLAVNQSRRHRLRLQTRRVAIDLSAYADSRDSRPVPFSIPRPMARHRRRLSQTC